MPILIPSGGFTVIIMISEDTRLRRAQTKRTFQWWLQVKIDPLAGLVPNIYDMMHLSNMIAGWISHFVGSAPDCPDVYSVDTDSSTGIAQEDMSAVTNRISLQFSYKPRWLTHLCQAVISLGPGLRSRGVELGASDRPWSDFIATRKCRIAYDSNWHGRRPTQRHRKQPFDSAVPFMITIHLLSSAQYSVLVCAEPFASLSICRKLLE